MKTIKLTGPFSPEDIAEFVALLRRIDGASPTNLYAITIADPDCAQYEVAEAMLEKLLPPLPERLTQRARAAYRDDTCPERTCDECGKPYRGPAVYCSLDCALGGA